MKTELEWLDDAIATKDISSPQTYYLVKGKTIFATNGRMMAGYPCKIDGEFLAPGEELIAILKRLPDEPTLKVDGDRLILRSGRFSGSLRLLPPEEWRFPVLEDEVEWKKFPTELIPILRELRPFVSDNNIHRWSLGIAINKGWCYATNNVVLAGAPSAAVKSVEALVPAWVVDFVLGRTEGLTHWAYTANYMAFKWKNGAWMRSSLIDDKFPERAAEMIRSAAKGSQKVSADYKAAVERITALSDDKVSIFADRIVGKTERSDVEEAITSATPDHANASIWGAKYIGPVIAIATSWEPKLWPAPVPFVGERIRGYIAGRTA